MVALTEGPHAVPELGQLVDVRRRQFIVADVARSAFVTDGTLRQHLVSLTSIEDDALGDELQVIWEIEPGARILERSGLPIPDGFDDPIRLEAFLHALQWGAVTDADYQAVQSPFRSGITIEDYQLDPVVRAIQRPRANLLIADDVGLGKTIEAGLVIQELLLRHRARTVLVVCPASLQTKWRDEMQEKFGLEFRIVDTDLLRELRRSRGIHVNPWTHFPRLITSIDWMKRDIPMRMLRDVLPPRPTYPRRFDILVLDEAHNVAPTGTWNYVIDSQRTRAIRALAPHFEHRLFLTATPHNGYPVSFSSLLELLDDQRFARGVPLEEGQLAQVMVRRMKADIVDWKGDPKFPKRTIVPVEVPYSDEERAIHRALTEYTRLRQVALEGEGRRHATEFVLKLLKKRLFSSPAAFALTLETHRRTLAGLGRPTSTSNRQAIRIMRQAISEADEDYADDERYEDSMSEAVAIAASLSKPIAERESELLDQMSTWAQRARNRPDSKVQALLAWLDETVRQDGRWTDRRVIVFTEYRATQNYLVEMLTSHGFGDRDRLMTMFGGMDKDQRDQIKAAFQASPRESSVRVLVATDAASEGIDLQNHCNLMVHYEIPWNPNRLEQRNGRIDRHGQRYGEVLIHHFVGTGYQDLPDGVDIPVGELEADLEFLMRAVRKVEQIREDLGRVGTVIAEQVQEAMLGRRLRLDTVAAEGNARQAMRVLAVERRVREQIERLHDRLLESRRRLEITPGNVQKVVEVALELAGQPPLRPTHLDGLDEDIPVFDLPAFSGTWTSCTRGILHPHTGRPRPISFDHRAIEGRDDVVLAHLEHRLVQMCLRLLRAEVWAPDNVKRMHRVTAALVRESEFDTPAVIAHARLLVIGDDRHRLHEEVIRAGGVFRRGRFARLTATEIDRALALEHEDQPSPRMLGDLQALWPEMEAGLLHALEARKTDRTAPLLAALGRRREKETADMASTLQELKDSVESELVRTLKPEQLEMWSDPEREQFRRNIEGLKARVAAIPDEIKRETEVISRRYADPDLRLFPVAVTFLVPATMK